MVAHSFTNVGYRGGFARSIFPVPNVPRGIVFVLIFARFVDATGDSSRRGFSTVTSSTIDLVDNNIFHVLVLLPSFTASSYDVIAQDSLISTSDSKFLLLGYLLAALTVHYMGYSAGTNIVCYIAGY